MAEDRMLNDEILLGLINANSGGGGGGTTNYNDLSNKPQIGGNTLQGDKSLADLGIAAKSTVDGILDGHTIDSFGDVETALADKADKSAVKNEFIGTTDEWNALTTEQKKAYDTYQITDDFISGGGSGLEIKTYEYTGDGTTQHTINLNDADAKFVLSLRRKDGLIFTEPFSMTATKTMVNWTTPNFGQNYLSLFIENSAITVNGVDAGQTCNSNNADYVVEYLAGSASGSGSEDGTNYLYNGEAEPENFTMPSGTAMQPLFTGKYGMDFKGGAGDFIRVATSKTAIDFTGISKLRFVGLHYESFDVLMGSFIEDVDVTNITGSKYLSVGYKTTMQNNSAVYAITDTATVTSSDTVAIKTKTGATNVSMFTQIIAE